MPNSISNKQIHLQTEMMANYNRRVSFGDLITDRSKNAQQYGFGVGSSMYDNVLVIGDVKVGKNTWIGPNVVLDGSGGGLTIGDFCSISSGVQIYTHHTVAWATSMGEEPVEQSPTKIGSSVYIGPNSIIQMGVTVGDKSVIGAMSFVNRNVAVGGRVCGQPARPF